MVDIRCLSCTEQIELLVSYRGFDFSRVKGKVVHCLVCQLNQMGSEHLRSCSDAQSMACAFTQHRAYVLTFFRGVDKTNFCSIKSCVTNEQQAMPYRELHRNLGNVLVLKEYTHKSICQCLLTAYRPLMSTAMLKREHIPYLDRQATAEAATQ